MNIIIDEINELLELSADVKPLRVEQLPRSGSDRIYFRVFLLVCSKIMGRFIKKSFYFSYGIENIVKPAFNFIIHIS